MKTKMITVLVAAIVVVAALAVAIIVMSGNGDKDDRTFVGGTAGCLQVYGNANNDYVIDSKDVDLIKKIIDENLDWKEQYPFADANNDGRVTSADVTFTQNIIDATPTKKAPANVLCYATDKTDGYVEQVKVPVTCASFSFAATTLGLLNATGIVDPFVAVTKSTTYATYTEPFFTEKYSFLTDDAHSLGSSSVRPDATIAANFIKGQDDPLSIYIFSNANTYDYYNIRPSMNAIGISVIQINDASADPYAYASGLLVMGFLFGTADNDYEEKCMDAAKWMISYADTLYGFLDEIDSGKVTKLSAIATTSNSSISGPNSSNTKNLQYMGLKAALEGMEATGNTIKYNPDTDSWLNNYDSDIQVAMTSSISSDWNWFMADKDMKKAPEGLLKVVNQFKTMKNFKNTICLGLSIPAPLRDIVVLSYAYPSLVSSAEAHDYLTEFFYEYYGVEKGSMDNTVLWATPADLGLI